MAHDAAMIQTDRTLKSKADTSPEAMAKMVDAFAEFGVTRALAASFDLR
ncbi:hypothetical protein AB4Y40_14135 [Paraburkholderia sp. EG287B]